MKKKLKIIFFLVLLIYIIFITYKNFKDEVFIFFLKNCDIEQTNLIPSKSTLIVGHAYGSPGGKNNFISEKIRKLIIENDFKDVIFTGDVLKLPSKDLWQELVDFFYNLDIKFYISPGNHDIGIGDNDLLRIYKNSKIKPQIFPFTYVTNDFNIIIENTTSNNWGLSSETINLIKKKKYDIPLIVLTHQIIISDLQKFANSKQGMPEKILSSKHFQDYNFTIISGDSGAFQTQPRISCHKRNKFRYIINGIGDVDGDTVLILYKGKLFSHKII